MDITEIIAKQLDIRPAQVRSAIRLIDEGNTIPFIARYRKEATGSLSDEQLRALYAKLTYLRSLQEKKEQVLSAIEEQGKLTEELRREIEQAETLTAVDDLYRPFRPKRRTRASAAREKGLEGLALTILAQRLSHSVTEEAQRYISAEKGVASAEEAIQGAKDILAEMISDDARYRRHIRQDTLHSALIVSEAKDPSASSVYENYYQFSEPIRRVAGYKVLALNRGEKEKMLTVKIRPDEDAILRWLRSAVIRGNNPYTQPVLEDVVKDSYDRLIAPSIEREIRSELTQSAQEGAIGVFGKNLTQLLMQPPISGHTVLGWDPAFRTGCKLAVIDPTGKVLDTTIIYPTQPTNDAKIRAAKDKVKQLIERYDITLISLGNGTASRESEQIIAKILKEIPDRKVSYVITSEAGASVYSASELATAEMPDYDVGYRSAASIARRVQDPLAELVKIDPKAIGVGQYQHDMDQKQLGEALSGVVESCVNRVGVDVNTASAPLMSYVAGISRTVAGNIVACREANGRFTNRKELKKVPGLGPKAFEQCAGFMRIRGGSEPLDMTGIHPESYDAANALLKELGIDKKSLTGKGAAIRPANTQALAAQLGIGRITLEDIIAELNRPGRDPRSDMPAPVLRGDVLKMEDLKEGMILKGTVRNVIDFGAFVDIGVHQDGLVHISQLTDKKFVRHPLEVVSVGDVVDVKVLQVDAAKKRISLTMIL